jgi:hypothetical protein
MCRGNRELAMLMSARSVTTCATNDAMNQSCLNDRNVARLRLLDVELRSAHASLGTNNGALSPVRMGNGSSASFMLRGKMMNLAWVEYPFVICVAVC